MSIPTPVSGVAPHEWSKKAIAGVVFSLIGFATTWLIFGLLFSAAGAVCGHLARYETSVLPLRGRRLATFGLVLGYTAMLCFPFIALFAAASFPAIGKWRMEQEAQHRAASRAHASRLFVACEAYARANRDNYPVEWEVLSGRFLPSDEFAELLRSPYPGGSRIAFELVRHDRPVLEAIGDSVVVIQEIAPARIPEIAVVYANGKVATLHNPDHEEP